MGNEIYASKGGKTYKFDYAEYTDDVDWILEEDYEFISNDSRNFSTWNSDVKDLGHFFMYCKPKDINQFCEWLKENISDEDFVQDFNDYFNYSEEDNGFVGEIAPEAVSENIDDIMEFVAECMCPEEHPELVYMLSYEDGWDYIPIEARVWSSSEGEFNEIGKNGEGMRGKYIDGILAIHASNFGDDYDLHEAVKFFSQVYWGNIFDVSAEVYDDGEWYPAEDCEDVYGPWTNDNDLEKIVTDAGFIIVPSPEGV